ncbi:hypothetical protein SAMN05421670_2733 [Psychrobacillus psychrotolerans]|uniref:DUF5412 domain-containing protein n=1 Tax=Psychrobacillus psychrotolerans TaxID=126156 RepID=A0A1I5ZIX2_9BACI|nr:DUF5412 domain-containing protein [Psychrobacillus psychrotolerans]SFQ56408.1 hypothetical protein SAMN05421670_2733 [Psychrobacillus psychrotolerans]
MNRKVKVILLVTIIPITVILVLLGIFLYTFFVSMESLPKGEFLVEESSPDGKFTLKAYVTNGGATTSYAVRGELVFNEKNGKTKNIYWNYREEDAEISWVDNDTVIINNHTLNVPKEKYDFRSH